MWIYAVNRHIIPTHSFLKGVIFNSRPIVLELYFNISISQLRIILPRTAQQLLELHISCGTALLKLCNKNSRQHVAAFNSGVRLWRGFNHFHTSWGAQGAVRAPPSGFTGTIIFLFFKFLSKVENLSSRKKLSSSMFTTSKSKPHICISKLCLWGEWHNTPEYIAHFRPFWSRCEMFSTISLPLKHIVYL